MIDTVKLQLNQDEYVINGKFAPLSSSERGVRRFIRNPSTNELKAGLYPPRLTLMRRPTSYGATKDTLMVEFSAPKLLLGNNFEELTNSDFPKLVQRLEEALDDIGVTVTREVIVAARVVTWHPSKNVIYNDHFACQTVINAIRKTDISRTYDFQKTDFRDGEALHIHCNAKDVIFYDKIADLRKSIISDKRAIENHSKIQAELLRVFDDIGSVSVLRFEIRLSGTRMIRQAFPDVEQLSFQNLFDSTLSQRYLINEWRQLAANIDYISLDNGYHELLQNYLSEHTDMTPQAALAAVAGIIVINQVGAREFRKTLDAQFGAHFWPRYKHGLSVAGSHHLEHVMTVGSTLERFEPTSLSQLKQMKTLENNC